MISTENWGDIAEVATHLQVTKDSIYCWVDSKNFPTHRVGRLLRFKLSEVDDWVRFRGYKHTFSKGKGRGINDN